MTTVPFRLAVPPDPGNAPPAFLLRVPPVHVHHDFGGMRTLPVLPLAEVRVFLPRGALAFPNNVGKELLLCSGSSRLAPGRLRVIPVPLASPSGPFVRIRHDSLFRGTPH